MTRESHVNDLSDRDLLDTILRAATEERRATIELLRLLGELDVRRLYLGEGCSSLFTYCTQVLRLSEHAAYHRIEVARAARSFPAVLELLAEGALTLTSAAILRPHLTTENHADVLAAARHKTKREVEELAASLSPQPDVRALVRKLGTPTPKPSVRPPLGARAESPAASPAAVRPSRPIETALAPDRYLLRVTISADTHRKLRLAQDLMRHTLPNGDPAEILDRALTVLVDQIQRRKFAQTKPRPEKRPHRTGTRHIPAVVRQEVWARDGGRCTFEGSQGRCRETGRLEFHHVVPFAHGGPATTSNITLRCQAHNQFESGQLFGPYAPTRSGPS